MRAQAGFTLLEILAALALLAMLMLGVWGGIRTVAHGVRQGRGMVTRLDTRRGTEQFLRRNLAHVHPIAWARTTTGRAVVFVGKPHVMRFVASLPGFLGRMGPQLQTLRLVPDGHGTLRLEVAFALLPPDGSTPRAFGKPEVLMTGIRKGHFVYRGFDRKRRDTGWLDRWTDPSRLPTLVEVALQPAQGIWPTLEVPLRLNGGAVNRAAINVTKLPEVHP